MHRISPLKYELHTPRHPSIVHVRVGYGTQPEGREFRLLPAIGDRRGSAEHTLECAPERRIQPFDLLSRDKLPEHVHPRAVRI